MREGAHAHEAVEFLGASLRVVAHGLNASTLASRTQMCGRRLRHKQKHSAFDRTSTPVFDILEFSAKTLNLPPSHKATAAHASRRRCEQVWRCFHCFGVMSAVIEKSQDKLVLKVKSHSLIKCA